MTPSWFYGRGKRSRRLRSRRYVSSCAMSHGHNPHLADHLSFFRSPSKISLGAELAVTAGPVGAGAMLDTGIEVSPVFSYVKSKVRSPGSSTLS
jgi:hypothetical protein